MQVVSTLREGGRQMIEFDAQLTKSKAVIHGFVGDASIAIDILRERIVNFSKESGIAVTKLASTFYRFGTVGINFRDAMEATIITAKLAKATFSDVETIARSMATVYLMLGKNMDATLTPSEKMNRIAAIIYELWRKNAFEVNEFAASLQRFSSIANMANFTVEETLGLLAALSTAGVQGARGGTVLANAIFRLIQNLDELAPALGIGISEGERLYDVFRRVINAIAETGKVGATPPETLKVISDVFGVRAGQIISAIIAFNEELEKSTAITRNYGEEIEKLNKRYQEVITDISGSAERVANLKKHIGEAFVRAIAGGETFEESLKNIAFVLDNIVIPTMQGFGSLLRFIFMLPSPFHIWAEGVDKYTKRVEKALKILEALGAIVIKLRTEITLEGLAKLREEFDMLYDRLVKEVIRMGKDAIPIPPYEIFIELFLDREEQIKVLEEQREKEAEITVETEKQLTYRRKIYELQKDLTGYAEELKYTKLLVEGANDFVIAQAKAIDKVKELVEAYNRLKPPPGEELIPIDVEGTIKILRDAILGVVTAEEVQEYFKFYPEVRNVEEFKNAIRAVNDLLKAELEYYKDISAREKERLDIQHRLNMAKIEGNLTTAELILYEKELVENAKEAYTEYEKKLRLYELELKYAEEMFRLMVGLTKQEQAQIEWSKKLAELKASKLYTEEQIIQLQIEEIKNNKLLYETERERLKAIAALEEELINIRATNRAREEELEIETKIRLAEASGLYNARELLLYKMQLIEASQALLGPEEKKLELLRLQTEYVIEMNRIARQYGEEFGSAIQQATKELLKQEITFSEFVDRIREKLIDMWAEALSKRLTDPLKGIFGGVGGIFGGLETGVLGGFQEGSLIAYNSILSAFREGSALVPGQITTGIQGGVGGVFTGMQRTPMGVTPTWSPFGIGGRLGGRWMQNLLQIGMGGMAGGWRGAGITALSLINPWLGLAGTLIEGLFRRKRRVEERVEVQQITSRIDITNRQLEIVNRNLIALRQDMRTYILPETAYFAEKRLGIEEEFALHRERGLS